MNATYSLISLSIFAFFLWGQGISSVFCNLFYLFWVSCYSLFSFLSCWKFSWNVNNSWLSLSKNNKKKQQRVNWNLYMNRGDLSAGRILCRVTGHWSGHFTYNWSLKVTPGNFVLWELPFLWEFSCFLSVSHTPSCQCRGSEQRKDHPSFSMTSFF